MKCPYCGEEMESGLIQSGNEIAWLPVSKRKLAARARFFDGAVVLSEYSFLHGSAVISWLCRSCEKVIIDCAGSRCDLNR